MKILSVGMVESYSKVFTENDIIQYSQLTGDINSIHLDTEKAKQFGFKGMIAHGLLVGGLISTVIGTMLPGEGAIYLEQDLKFIKPVYLGDTCNATVSVEEVINLEKGIYKLKTIVKNQQDEVTLDGYAVIKYKVVP